MKKLFFPVLASLALWSTTGCTDLTETVYSSIPESEFYTNEKELISATIPVYSVMRNLLDWQHWWDLEETTDVAMTPVRGGWAWYDGGIYGRLHQHNWSYMDPHFDRIWSTLYLGVNYANKVIYQLENSTVEVPARASIIAEMKVARAFYYYLLCETFGNVPIVDRFDVPEDFLPSTSTRAEVFAFIEKDLTDALDPSLDLLSEDVRSTYGRFNKWNAMGILARLYLNAEAWIGVDRYDDCLSLCDGIILSNRYALAADFSQNFALDNHLCSESMFAIPFDEVYSGGQIYMMMRKTMHCLSTAQYNIATWLDGGGCASPSFVLTDRDVDWQKGPHIGNNYLEGDLRYEKTWMEGEQHDLQGNAMPTNGFFGWWGNIDYIKAVGNQADNVNGWLAAMDGDGVRFKKYEVKIGATETPDNDWVVMRYAEILFMKAECILRTEGNAQEAADVLNWVRRRAFEQMNEYNTITAEQLLATTDYNGVPVRFARMLQEWGVEFCLEGLRRSQLIRFDNNYIKGTWSYHNATNNPDKALCPIPGNQLAVNPNLRPNPGDE